MPDEDEKTVLLTGASGTAYEFKVYDPEASVPAAGGVFVVPDRKCDLRDLDADDVHLLGRSANLSLTLAQVRSHARLGDDDAGWWFCARIENDDPAERTRIARDLAASYHLQRSEERH
jgi:hypothetical protein